MQNTFNYDAFYSNATSLLLQNTQFLIMPAFGALDLGRVNHARSQNTPKGILKMAMKS